MTTTSIIATIRRGYWRALFRASLLGRFETADFETIAGAIAFVVSTSGARS